MLAVQLKGSPTCHRYLPDGFIQAVYTHSFTKKYPNFNNCFIRVGYEKGASTIFLTLSVLDASQQIHKIITVHTTGGTRYRSCLKHCATSRKVAGSITDGVIGIFHRHYSSGRTMDLGSTQPLTEVSTRNISWGVNVAGA